MSQLVCDKTRGLDARVFLLMSQLDCDKTRGLDARVFLLMSQLDCDQNDKIMKRRLTC